MDGLLVFVYDVETRGELVRIALLAGTLRGEELCVWNGGDGGMSSPLMQVRLVFRGGVFLRGSRKGFKGSEKVKVQILSNAVKWK